MYYQPKHLRDSERILLINYEWKALRISKKNENQKGGFVIAPWLAALLLSAGVKGAERVVDFIADKMQGKGMKKPKTVAERKTLISYLLK